MQERKIIYLDNAATTKISGLALDTMFATMVSCYANPSSLHAGGVAAARKLAEARRVIAGLLGADDKEVYFTSGGTEGNNTALRGVATNARRGKTILISAVEHPSLTEPAKALAGDFEVKFVPVDGRGRLDLDALQALLTPDVIFLGLQQVNSETGMIQPLEAAGAALKAAAPQAHYHIDGVQGFGKMPLQLKNWQADSYAVSAHKLHGPRGCGFLYLKQGRRLQPLLYGGGQERDLRSGTEDLASICALATAANDAYDNMAANLSKVKGLRDLLLDELKERGADFTVISDLEQALPYVLSVAFNGVRSEVLLHYLEQQDIYASSGSACHSNRSGISPVLSAMGIAKDLADGVVRFSFCPANSDDEMRLTAQVAATAAAEIKTLLGR